MPQHSKLNLTSLNTLELYKHHHALSSRISFLSDQAKEDLLDELKQCAGLRSKKIDGLYYAIVKNEKLVEVGKQELDSLKAAIKRHENEINTIKSYLKEIRRQGHAPDNKLTGENYEFTVYPVQDAIEISSHPDDWTDDQQRECAIVKRVVTTTVLETIDGQHIETSERSTQTTLPNLDAIRDLHSKGRSLPQGVHVNKNYAIRAKRIIKSLD